MGTWTATVTNKGYALQAKLLSTDKLNITRVVSGSGSCAVTQLINQTAVADIKQELTVDGVYYDNFGNARIKTTLSNTDLTTGYDVNQIGIYATDPDEGEILYAIAQVDKAEPVPSITEQPNGFYCSWDFALTYSNAQNVSVTIDNSQALTVEAGDMRYLNKKTAEEVYLKKEDAGTQYLKSSDAVGRNVKGKTFQIDEEGTTARASEGAEIFNDYRTREYYTNPGGTQVRGNAATGYYSTAIGEGTTATGYAAFASGYQTQAKGNYSEAKGEKAIANGIGASSAGNKSEADGSYSFSKGFKTKATGNYSFAIGYQTQANAKNSFAAGDDTYASGENGFAIGYDTNATGKNSFAMGTRSTAYGEDCFSGGWQGNTNGHGSFAFGEYPHAGSNSGDDYGFAVGSYTVAKARQFVAGKYNIEKTGVSSADSQSASENLFIVGWGTSTTRDNALRIDGTGKCYGESSFGGSNADFAEYFEWADGNPENEDRRGLIVTLDGKKIRPATAEDDYILGVITATGAFIGNLANEHWQDKYVTDVFGERITQQVEIPETVDEQTGEIIPAHTVTQFVVNPDYDPDKEYVSREFRQEWDAVGMLGQVVVVDDGSCLVNGYCTPSVNGIGTAGDKGYRVMERLDDTHIRVLVR